MFIKTTKNKNGTAYYHLVESYRHEGKVRQRTLMSLGRVEDGKLDQLAEAISKHSSKLSIFNMARDVDVKDTFILGPLLVLQRMMDELGVSLCLSTLQDKHKRLEFNFKGVVFSQICSRFLKPVSKLALYDNWIDRMYPQMIEQDIALQHMYRSLDLLSDHKEDIEKFLFAYGKNLFDISVDVVLYDLTTLRFESTRTDLGNLRQYGYSKEMRTDCTQVVLGLLTDTQGIPLCFEVHPGNTFEGKTLDGIVNRISKKLVIRRFIFVADRGLFSMDNLEHIKSRNGEFIVGLRMGALKAQIQNDFYDLSKFHWANPELAVRETSLNDDRCIITWSKIRAERDRKAREDILDKIKTRLSSSKPLSKKFITNRAFKKYLSVNNDTQCNLNHRAISKEAEKDGFFGIITNVKEMSATEIVSNYKELWRIEDAFGEMKGTLKSRPMFHWTDKRIIGHLMLCFLSHFCEAHLTKKLREAGIKQNSKAITEGIIKNRPLTTVAAMEELMRVMAVPVKVKNEVIWLRTDIPPNAVKLIKAIGMRIPPKILPQNKKM
ncbi:MAG TPA: IS1634 family transposase [Candidatus Cloacimonetes bacterium]|nr:IS1634 family transposase [Candidatus Cloacimonadota bacterium]